MISRYGLAALIPAGGIMLELGVAAGDGAVGFLENLCPSAAYIGVDMWAGDGAIQKHDDAEYQEALAKVRGTGHARATLVRATFEEAYLGLVQAEPYFDLVYLDGYAHAGSGGPEEMRRWYGLVKPGGYFAVHDYCETWPEQVKAFNESLRLIGRPFFSTTTSPEEFTTAFIRKV